MALTTDLARPVSGKGKRNSLIYQQRIFPYIFIAPFFITFVVFFLGPAIYAFYAGFQDWNLLGGMKFVGIKNYAVLVQDKSFWQSFLNTIYYQAAGPFIQWPLALFLAVILNTKIIPGRQALRTIYFIPVLTAPVVVAIMFIIFLDKDYGLFNAPLTALNLQPINWLGSRELSKIAVLILVIWRWTGHDMILFLAGLQAIPQDLYEAASVDGATRVQAFFRITLPLLQPTIAYVVIMGLIGGWQLFDESWLLTRGGPADSSLSIANYLYRVSFANMRMGYGAAIGTVLFLVLFAFTIFQMRILGVYREAEA